MKSRFLVSIVLTLSLLSTVTVAAEIAHDVDIPFEDVHVPLGFDSNDKAIEFVVTGNVPTPCYYQPKGVVKIEGNSILVEMKAIQIVDKDVACIEAVVPYLVTVSLGQLREGNYNIKVNPGKESEKATMLVVGKPRSDSIDDFDYANVTSVEMNHDDGILLLKGAHPSSCINIDRIEMVPNPNRNTFAVLPIVRQDFPVCDRMMKKFAYEIPIPKDIRGQSVVFHIRKIAGNSLNVRW